MELTWNFAPSVLVGIALWTIAYVTITGPLRQRKRWGASPAVWRQAAFHLGSLIALLALISPLDELGDGFLFSAHMIQHLLLLYVTAPCWLLGIPDWLPGLALRGKLVRLARQATRPPLAYAIFAGMLLFWHVPSIYGLAQDYEGVHVTEHLMYLGAGLIGWWPIAAPARSALPRPSAPARMLFLFALALPCSLLGAILTFAQTPLYSYYAHAPRVLGLSVVADQRLGGLLMWVPTHMLLLLCLTIIAGQWLSGRNEGVDPMPNNHVQMGV
jgi:cytochrome c oxidase assembly factor CtaG